MLLNVLFYATVCADFQQLFSVVVLLMCNATFQVNFENECDSEQNESELMPGWQIFDHHIDNVATNHFSPFWPMSTSHSVNFGQFCSRIFGSGPPFVKIMFWVMSEYHTHSMSACMVHLFAVC